LVWGSVHFLWKYVFSIIILIFLNFFIFIKIPLLILVYIFSVSLKFKLPSIFIAFGISFNFFEGWLYIERLKLIIFYKKYSIVNIVHVWWTFDKVASQSTWTLLSLVLCILEFHIFLFGYVLCVYYMHYFLLKICLRHYFLILLCITV
jgi:hypothetical protein